MKEWKVKAELLNIKNQWIQFIGEKCIDNENKELEYYRVIRADSVVIIPIINNHIIKPQSYYRHGIKKHTLDFPGGRLTNSEIINETITDILEKELHIQAENITEIDILNISKPWHVDSSFSSQKLYAATVQISPNCKIFKKEQMLKITKENILNLYNIIDCLQCRMTLIEWYLNPINKGKNKNE